MVGGSAVHGSHKYQAPQAKERVWLGGVMGSAPACRSGQQSLQGQKEVRTPMSASPLNKDPGARNWTGAHYEERVKAGEKGDTFHTGQL